LYSLTGFRSNPSAAFGIILILAFVFLGVAAPLLAPYPPYETNPAWRLLPPSLEHLFGTDQYGQDVFSRVLYGTRVTLFIALLAVILGLTVGTTLGALAGYLGRVTDEFIMRSMDMLQAFPSFILAMAVATAVGPGLITLIVANAVVNVPLYARVLRSKMLSIKQGQFASAAICVGNPRGRIILVHMLPNCIGPVIIQATLQSGWAILATAGLSFLGLGLRIPAAEWGVMIQMGSRYMITGYWWVSFFPGFAIFLAVMGFSLLGDGLRAYIDPKGK
jgi:peptide/nickel transport system permease protein